jgi:5-methylthioadenosine/S-adenosylhomocysteine deaminase
LGKSKELLDLSLPNRWLALINVLKEPGSAARQIVYAESERAVETVFVDGRPVVRGGKLVTLDETKLAAEAAELAPAFRRDAANLAARNSDLVAPLLDANRAAWKVPLGIHRYVGRTEG